MLEYLDSARVAKTYWPERLELVESLPRTPSGKIQKFMLRDRRRGELVTDMTTPRPPTSRRCAPRSARYVETRASAGPS